MTPSKRSDAAARLIAAVERFPGQRVAVVGDLVADEFVYGDIARVSREAPVLILNHRQTVVVPGGAGNSVANLRALGAHPIPIGVLGRDESGRCLRRHFRRLGVPVTGILTDAAYGTPTKSRILAGGIHTRRQQIVRIDRGAAPGGVPRELHRKIDSALRAVLPSVSGLLVADYGYDTVTPERLAPLLRRSRDAAWPVTVDSRTRVARFRNATACTPNQEELEQALGGRPFGEPRELARAGAELLRASGNRAALVTQGAQGMTLIQRGSPPLAIPAYGSDEVADVTGAGDTVIATFTLALIAGAGPADAARIANYAAGLVVAKAGTATVSRAELIRAIREDTD